MMRSLGFFFLLLLLAVYSLNPFSTRTAWAFTCAAYTGTCQVQTGAADTWWQSNPDFSQLMKQFILNDIYKDKILDDWWKSKFRPALQAMTAQLIGADTHTAGMIGGFYDGLSLNRAQLTMQELQADALKSYTPGENLCRFGTSVRSLSASEVRAVSAQMALAEIGQARQLGTRGGPADAGGDSDRATRLDQFTRIYCDPADNQGALDGICGGTSPKTKGERMNKDISFIRTLAGPNTLDVDFTNAQSTADEEDLIALASNLYGHDVLPRYNDIMLSGKAGNADNKVQYLNLRQMVAFRNVAQNSFNAMAGKRARGTEGAAVFLRNVLEELGMTKDEAKRYLDGSNGEPSYNAQMEILTKKIYQNPNFYTNLIDKPANVDRSIAAMNAFSLMQDRDVAQSFARQEMLLSLLLELKIRREQRDVERRMKLVGLTK